MIKEKKSAPMQKEMLYWICPINKNHKSQTERQFRRHLDRCKELKNVKLYKCPFRRSHVFLFEHERDQHIQECPCNDENLKVEGSNEIEQESEWRIVEPIYEPSLVKKKKIESDVRAFDEFKPPLNKKQIEAQKKLKDKLKEKKRVREEMKKKLETAQFQYELEQQKLKIEREDLATFKKLQKGERIEELKKEKEEIEARLVERKKQRQNLKGQVEELKERVFKDSKSVHFLEIKQARRQMATQREKLERVVKELKRIVEKKRQECKELEYIAGRYKDTKKIDETIEKLKQELETLREQKAKDRSVESCDLSESETGKKPRSLATKFKYVEMKKRGLDGWGMSDFSSESESETSLRSKRSIGR